MLELLSPVADVAAVGQTFAAGQIQADGILGLITVKSEEAKAALQAVAMVVVIVFVVVIAAKTKMSIAAIAMAAIVGGVVLWLVNGGVNVAKDLTGEELEASTSISVVVDPSAPPLV
jgi:hypothetical protein